VALLSGLAVRGTVRDAKWTSAVRKAMPGTEVARVDLLNCSEEELATAMAGCAFLAHVASPFPGGDVSDDEMKTAIEGTAKVLRAAKAAGVTRVVLTSSVAAVGGGEHTSKGTAARPFTSAAWSPELMSSSYAVSKTQAEKGAWALAAELGLEMTTIHPSFVNGPLLLPRTPTSTAMAKRILEGAMPAVPAIGLNVVGVNDVAEAHVKALLAPDTVGQRLLVAAGNLLMTDLAVAIKRAHGADGWPVKTTRLPWVGMWLYSFFD
jgi:dihydroflavonol-4-reductase